MQHFAVSEANFSKAKALEKLRPEGVRPADTLMYDLLAAYHRNDLVEEERLHGLIDREIKKEPKPREIPFEYKLANSLIWADDYDDAERVLQRPHAPGTDPKLVDELYAQTNGLLDIFRGRLREGTKALEASDPEDHGAEFETAFHPFPLYSNDELRQLRDHIGTNDSTVGEGKGPQEVLRPQFRLYELALLNCRMGNTAQALAQAQQLESLPAPPYWMEAMRAMATDVRAFADAARGNPKQALARIESIPIDVPLDLLRTDGRRLPEVYWRGEWLYQAGRYDEALQWFENPVDQTSSAWPFFKLRRAQIYSRKGDWQHAAPLYTQVLATWKDPDPELRPLVEQARSALAAHQRKVD